MDEYRVGRVKENKDAEGEVKGKDDTRSLYNTLLSPIFQMRLTKEEKKKPTH